MFTSQCCSDPQQLIMIPDDCLFTLVLLEHGSTSLAVLLLLITDRKFTAQTVYWVLLTQQFSFNVYIVALPCASRTL